MIWILTITGAMAAMFISLCLYGILQERELNRVMMETRARYFDTHPPISDEEFLSLLDPSVDPVVALKVRQIFSEVSCVAPSRIYPDATWADLGLD